MAEPTRLGQIKIYQDVSLDELAKLMEEKVISVKEFYQIVETGKLENDQIRIYKKKNNKNEKNNIYKD